MSRTITAAVHVWSVALLDKWSMPLGEKKIKQTNWMMLSLFTMKEGRWKREKWIIETEKHHTMLNVFNSLQFGSFRKVDLGIIWDGAPTPPEIPEQICHGVIRRWRHCGKRSLELVQHEPDFGSAESPMGDWQLSEPIKQHNQTD